MKRRIWLALPLLLAFACAEPGPTLYVAADSELEGTHVFLNGVDLGSLTIPKGERTLRRIFKSYVGERTVWVGLIVPIADLHTGEHVVRLKLEDGRMLERKFVLPEALQHNQVFLHFRASTRATPTPPSA